MLIGIVNKDKILVTKCISLSISKRKHESRWNVNTGNKATNKQKPDLKIYLLGRESLNYLLAKYVGRALLQNLRSQHWIKHGSFSLDSRAELRKEQRKHANTWNNFGVGCVRQKWVLVWAQTGSFLATELGERRNRFPRGMTHPLHYPCLGEGGQVEWMWTVVRGRHFQVSPPEDFVWQTVWEPAFQVTQIHDVLDGQRWTAAQCKMGGNVVWTSIKMMWGSGKKMRSRRVQCVF